MPLSALKNLCHRRNIRARTCPLKDGATICKRPIVKSGHEKGHSKLFKKKAVCLRLQQKCEIIQETFPRLAGGCTAKCNWVHLLPSCHLPDRREKQVVSEERAWLLTRIFCAFNNNWSAKACHKTLQSRHTLTKPLFARSRSAWDNFHPVFSCRALGDRLPRNVQEIINLAVTSWRPCTPISGRGKKKCGIIPCTVL